MRNHIYNIELDLITATNIEWKTMEEIKTDKLASMKKARAEYDEEMEMLLEEQEAANKPSDKTKRRAALVPKPPPKKGKKGKKGKSKKIIDPPMVVDANTVVDVSKEYQQHEMNMVDGFYNCLNPSTFLLESGEVK